METEDKIARVIVNNGFFMIIGYDQDNKLIHEEGISLIHEDGISLTSISHPLLEEIIPSFISKYFPSTKRVK